MQLFPHLTHYGLLFMHLNSAKMICISIFAHTIVLIKEFVCRYDRAYRKYLKIDSIPGIIVNSDFDNIGGCLSEITTLRPELANATRQDVISHLRKVAEEMNSSDKENNPKEKLKSEPVTEIEKCHEFYMCSTDPNNCVVHSANLDTPRWSFYHTAEQLQSLIESLNKRGIRESDLRINIESDLPNLETTIAKCPVHILNPDIEISEENQIQLRSKGKNKYDDANLGFPSDMAASDVLHNLLVDNILELEEKIHVGSLGALKVKNREMWRECILNKNYSNLDKTIVRGQDTKISNGDVKSEGNLQFESKNMLCIFN